MSKQTPVTTIDDIMHPQASVDMFSAQILVIDEMLARLGSRSTRNPEPLLSSVEGSASASCDISTQPTLQAESCSNCHGTGRRNRERDGAPMACWCEAGDLVDDGRDLPPLSRERQRDAEFAAAVARTRA